jgi:hypothetical protein
MIMTWLTESAARIECNAPTGRDVVNPVGELEAKVKVRDSMVELGWCLMDVLRT